MKSSKIISLLSFIICFFIYLLFEFVIKVYFFEKILLNFTFNDFGEYIFKLIVLNETNQKDLSLLDFSSKFQHFKLKNF